MYVPTFLHTGAIKSDAGVQGLPCDGVFKQGKPCTPGVISSIAKSSCITFNRTPFIPKDTLRVMNNLTATLRYYRYPQHAWAFHVSNALKLYSRSEKVIDACCGDGIISYWLAHWHPETQFIGIDLEHNEDACSWIKQKCPNLDFIQGDINNEIPAYKGSTLLIINSLFVIPDTERLISLFSGLFPVAVVHVNCAVSGFSLGPCGRRTGGLVVAFLVAGEDRISGCRRGIAHWLSIEDILGNAGDKRGYQRVQMFRGMAADEPVTFHGARNGCGTQYDLVVKMNLCEPKNEVNPFVGNRRG